LQKWVLFYFHIDNTCAELKSVDIVEDKKSTYTIGDIVKVQFGNVEYDGEILGTDNEKSTIRTTDSNTIRTPERKKRKRSLDQNEAVHTDIEQTNNYIQLESLVRDVFCAVINVQRDITDEK
ncbi:unnamed protein product, partial [Didymodactylos carnosus]